MTITVYYAPPRRKHRCDDCWCVTVYTGRRSETTRHATRELADQYVDQITGTKS